MEPCLYLANAFTFFVREASHCWSHFTTLDSKDSWNFRTSSVFSGKISAMKSKSMPCTFTKLGRCFWTDFVSGRMASFSSWLKLSPFLNVWTTLVTYKGVGKLKSRRSFKKLSAPLMLATPCFMTTSLLNFENSDLMWSSSLFTADASSLTKGNFSCVAASRSRAFWSGLEMFLQRVRELMLAPFFSSTAFKSDAPSSQSKEETAGGTDFKM